MRGGISPAQGRAYALAAQIVRGGQKMGSPMFGGGGRGRGPTAGASAGRLGGGTSGVASSTGRRFIPQVDGDPYGLQVALQNANPNGAEHLSGPSQPILPPGGGGGHSSSMDAPAPDSALPDAGGGYPTAPGGGNTSFLDLGITPDPVSSAPQTGLTNSQLPGNLQLPGMSPDTAVISSYEPDPYAGMTPRQRWMSMMLGL